MYRNYWLKRFHRFSGWDNLLSDKNERLHHLRPLAQKTACGYGDSLRYGNRKAG